MRRVRNWKIPCEQGASVHRDPERSCIWNVTLRDENKPRSDQVGRISSQPFLEKGEGQGHVPQYPALRMKVTDEGQELLDQPQSRGMIPISPSIRH
jgi:hypothetical protein